MAKWFLGSKLAFLRTFLGLEVAVHSEASRTVPLGRELWAGPRGASVPLSPPGFLPPELFSFNILGLSAGFCTVVGGRGHMWKVCGVRVLPDPVTGALVVTQPGYGLQVSQNKAGGGGGPQAGSVGVLLALRNPRSR